MASKQSKNKIFNKKIGEIILFLISILIAIAAIWFDPDLRIKIFGALVFFMAWMNYNSK